MPVFFVSINMTIPVVADSPEQAQEIALDHLRDEQENAEVEVKEIETPDDIRGQEDVLPWGNSSNLTLQQHIQGD